MFQYDVELYQRIEHLIGKKLPLYEIQNEEVMCLEERVGEAKRTAAGVITPLLPTNLLPHFVPNSEDRRHLTLHFVFVIFS